jgi:hypothetical protein
MEGCSLPGRQAQEDISECWEALEVRIGECRDLQVTKRHETVSPTARKAETSMRSDTCPSADTPVQPRIRKMVCRCLRTYSLRTEHWNVSKLRAAKKVGLRLVKPAHRNLMDLRNRCKFESVLVLLDTEALRMLSSLGSAERSRRTKTR